MQHGFPIEFAPQDRRVLLWHEGIYKVWHIGWFNHADEQWELVEAFKSKDEPYAAPTHWFPLPGDELDPVAELVRNLEFIKNIPNQEGYKPGASYDADSRMSAFKNVANFADQVLRIHKERYR